MLDSIQRAGISVKRNCSATCIVAVSQHLAHGADAAGGLGGVVMASVTILPAGPSRAGMSGAIGFFVSDATQAILDINGYFAS